MTVVVSPAEVEVRRVQEVQPTTQTQQTQQIRQNQQSSSQAQQARRIQRVRFTDLTGAVRLDMVPVEDGSQRNGFFLVPLSSIKVISIVTVFLCVLMIGFMVVGLFVEATNGSKQIIVFPEELMDQNETTTTSIVHHSYQELIKNVTNKYLGS